MKTLKHFKVFNSFFRLVILIQFTASETSSDQISTTAPAVQIHSQDELLNLNKRMSEMEAKNHLQENEIALLKTLRVEDKESLEQLRNRIEQLEASTDQRQQISMAKRRRSFQDRNALLDSCQQI